MKYHLFLRILVFVLSFIKVNSFVPLATMKSRYKVTKSTGKKVKPNNCIIRLKSSSEEALPSEFNDDDIKAKEAYTK